MKNLENIEIVRERERQRELFSKPIKKFFIMKKQEKQYKIKDKLHYIV